MIKHLLARIDINMGTFSKGQKRISKYIEEHYDKAAYMTALKLGETVGVSESTVVRFASELGYEGYPELQKAMQEMIKEKLTSVQRIEVTETRIGDNDVLTTVLNQDIDKIRRTIEEISHEDFDNAIKVLSKAKEIYVFAVRSTSALASFLGYYLQLIFGNVHIINTTSKSSTYENLFRISEDDVMIGISFPRYSTTAVEAMEFAQERKADVIAITDSMASPLVECANHILIARSDMASVVDSLVAPLSLINALIVACVLSEKERVKDTFHQLEDVWTKQGVYTKREKEMKEEKENA